MRNLRLKDIDGQLMRRSGPSRPCRGRCGESNDGLPQHRQTPAGPSGRGLGTVSKDCPPSPRQLPRAQEPSWEIQTVHHRPPPTDLPLKPNPETQKFCHALTSLLSATSCKIRIPSTRITGRGSRRIVWSVRRRCVAKS